MSPTRDSLVKDLNRGLDAERWPEFVRTYSPLLERTVRKVGIHPSDVDDVVQDVLITVVRGFCNGRYCKERGGLRVWLRRVTINKCYDRLRRQNLERPLVEPHQLPAAWPTEEEWSREWRLQTMQAAFMKVREEFRERTWACFAAHMLDRQTAATISRQLGLSENAVYINSSRVLNRIREYCSEQGESLIDVSESALS